MSIQFLKVQAFSRQWHTFFVCYKMKVARLERIHFLWSKLVDIDLKFTSIWVMSWNRAWWTPCNQLFVPSFKQFLIIKDYIASGLNFVGVMSTCKTYEVSKLERRLWHIKYLSENGIVCIPIQPFWTKMSLWDIKGWSTSKFTLKCKLFIKETSVSFSMRGWYTNRF